MENRTSPGGPRRANRRTLTNELLDAEAQPIIAIDQRFDELDLKDRDITTILWATGYRRTYPWLHVPVLDATGEIRQRQGRTPVPGLYVLGQRFQHYRNSNVIDGIGREPPPSLTTSPAEQPRCAEPEPQVDVRPDPPLPGGRFCCRVRPSCMHSQVLISPVRILFSRSLNVWAGWSACQWGLPLTDASKACCTEVQGHSYRHDRVSDRDGDLPVHRYRRLDRPLGAAP
jgi:hypothetical protein